MKNYYLNYKNREEKEYRIDSIISKWYLNKCNFSVFNRNEYCINQTKHNRSLDRLKRILFRNVLIVSMFLFACLIPCACTNTEEIDAANELINQFTTEQTTNTETTHDINVPVDTDKPEDTKVEEVTPVEPVTPVEDKQEEINPRDMKAVYNLEFDVPIYTEEEVEQARSNLQNNYQEYNDVEYGEGFTEEQIMAIKDDYYIANQDFLYQLYNMTKDFKAKTAYVDGSKKHFYLEDKDWYVEVEKGCIVIVGHNFEFVNGLNNKEELNVPNQLFRKEYISIGPGAYVTCFPQWYYDLYKDDPAYDKINCQTDLEELEYYGFHNNDMTAEFISYQSGKKIGARHL